MARIHRSQGSLSYLLEDDELTGEDVIPGFRCPLRDILPRPTPAETGPAMPPGPNGPRAESPTGNEGGDQRHS